MRLKGLFHSNSEIEKQYKEGKMGTAIGMKWSMDQLVAGRTVGHPGRHAADEWRVARPAHRSSRWLEQQHHQRAQARATSSPSRASTR
jgi:hypothetical protein